MVTFSDSAGAEIRRLIAEAGEDCLGLRLRAMKYGKHTFRYQLQLVRQDHITDADQAVEAESFTVYLDPQSLEWMDEARIDFVSTESGKGFQIDNPQATPQWEDPVAQKVQEVIDTRILPVVGQHGGWVELDGVEGDTAYILFGGGCQGCASANDTLQHGIQTVITQEVQEINQVVDRTAHGMGTNPYHSG
jgi:Fe/S biogenesis protein NfuA